MREKKIKKIKYELGGGGSGVSDHLTQHLIIKETKNALITFTRGTIKIEADLIDFGSPQYQAKLKKKYGIDSGISGGGGGEER